MIDMEYGYLSHHGIKGMKWGIRRYQTESGSLTAEGRKRYGLYGHKMEGTLKDRLKAYKTQAKQVNRLRVADYKNDIDQIKNQFKGKERRKQIREYNEYYNTGMKFAQKEFKRLASQKYGHDAVKKADKQATAAAIGALAGMIVAGTAVQVGANLLQEKYG